MREYTIAQANKMGEYHETYGQAFWCDTQEQLEPVKFNLITGDVQIGDKITAETVELRTSKKGAAYHQLKKVKVLGGERPTPAAKPGPMSESKLEQILELVKENNAMLRTLTESTPIFDPTGAPERDDDNDLSEIPY